MYLVLSQLHCSEYEYLHQLICQLSFLPHHLLAIITILIFPIKSKIKQNFDNRADKAIAYRHRSLIRKEHEKVSKVIELEIASKRIRTSTVHNQQQRTWRIELRVA